MNPVREALEPKLENYLRERVCHKIMQRPLKPLREFPELSV
jgi:hypothetical protein